MSFKYLTEDISHFSRSFNKHLYIDFDLKEFNVL